MGRDGPVTGIYTGDRQYIGNIRIGAEQDEVGKTGRPAFFHASTNVKLGDYFNAAKAYLDFGTAGTGEIAGMASAFNAEIRLPNKTVTSGAYEALEVNYNFQELTVLQDTADTPQVFAAFKAGGHQDGIDAWELQTYSGAFSFEGLAEGDGKILSMGVGSGAPTVAGTLRIIIGGTVYWLCLASKASTDS